MVHLISVRRRLCRELQNAQVPALRSEQCSATGQEVLILLLQALGRAGGSTVNERSRSRSLRQELAFSMTMTIWLDTLKHPASY